MDSFPAFFPLLGRKVVIVGSGDGAEAKARLFMGSPAELVRAMDGEALAPGLYDGALLAFIAVAEEPLAIQAAAAARAAGALVNVVDRPGLGDFTTPAVIDRGAVVAAVGTGGTAPILASLLRSDVEARIPPGAGRVAALLGRMQDEVRVAFPDLTRRRAFLREALSGAAAQAALDDDLPAAERLMREALAAATAAAIGRIRFVAGRGPADLLTLRAARALAEADVLIADADAHPDILNLARRDAVRPPSSTLDEVAALACSGLTVVRVTTGRPAEEIAAFQAAGVRTEQLPHVSTLSSVAPRQGGELGFF